MSAYPEFGIYLPVTPESAEALGELASAVSFWAGAYLRDQGNTTPVTPRLDFGITYASRQQVEDALLAAPDSFSLDAFLDAMRPIGAGTPDAVEVGLDKTQLPSKKPRAFRLELSARDPGVMALRHQAVAIGSACIAAGLGVSVNRPDHLSLVSYGGKDKRESLTVQQRGQIQSLIRRAKRRLGMRSAHFGELTIGPDYRIRLP